MERTVQPLGNGTTALPATATLITQLEALLLERQQVQMKLDGLGDRGYVDPAAWWAARRQLESIARAQERVLLSLQVLVPPDGQAQDHERKPADVVQPAASA
jgi:hypothetical protein